MINTNLSETNPSKVDLSTVLLNGVLLSDVRLIDLSVPLGPSPSEAVPVEVEYMSHEAGGAHLAQLVGTTPSCLHHGLGWASERVSAITHAGTHMDAPFHYAPNCQGAPSRTIDELPLEWFWGSGVCMPALGPSDELITVEEWRDFEATLERSVSAGTQVLFRTGAEERYGSGEYNRAGRGLDPQLVDHLAERGIRVLGTDAWSIDPSFEVMQQRRQHLGSETVWASHFVGRHREFCVIEKLTQLHRLPTEGFLLACFPIKVLRGSGGWVRPVAFVPTGQKERSGERCYSAA